MTNHMITAAKRLFTVFDRLATPLQSVQARGPSAGRHPKAYETVDEYWSHYHVEAPDSGFAGIEDSLAHYEWRNACYPGYIELMPVDQADGKIVADYGCGVGNDVIGFGAFSKPAAIHAIDISARALQMAKKRADLHQLGNVEFHEIADSNVEIPLPDQSVDILHSSGVIHHASDPEKVLCEFRRVLKPEGYAQVMVYHRDSLWMHLYVAYTLMLHDDLYCGLNLDTAFELSMDGDECPVARSYSAETFIELCARAGLNAAFTGASMSVNELTLLPERFSAIRDQRLNTRSRRFLSELTFNERGWPLHYGVVAGVNACFRLVPADF